MAYLNQYIKYHCMASQCRGIVKLLYLGTTSELHFLFLWVIGYTGVPFGFGPVQCALKATIRVWEPVAQTRPSSKLCFLR